LADLTIKIIGSSIFYTKWQNRGLDPSSDQYAGFNLLINKFVAIRQLLNSTGEKDMTQDLSHNTHFQAMVIAALVLR
jgi:hypothetical protein